MRVVQGEEEGRWSLVLTGFCGDYRSFDKAAQAAFGRSGLDTFTLALSRDEEGHRPAEIAARLTRARASAIAEALEQTGAAVAVVATEQLSEVRHRCPEVWPSRSVEGFDFTEVEDVIVLLAPLNARINVQRQREAYPDRPRWQMERGLNHVHVGDGDGPPREEQRTARQFAERLAAALEAAYPERGFVVEHWIGIGVTFYQAGEGAPEGDAPPERPAGPKAWCSRCGRKEAYQRRTAPDAEFPQAEWGECAVCGAEVMIRGGMMRTVTTARG